MKRLASLIIGLSTVSFGFFTLLEYDAMTHLNARILNGSVHADVTRQYTTIRPDGKTELDERGRDASMKVLTTKYAPACLAAGCATE